MTLIHEDERDLVSAVAALTRYKILTYLNLSNLRLALLINFDVPLIRDGIKRIAL